MFLDGNLQLLLLALTNNDLIILTDTCPHGFIFIPNLSPDGIQPLAIPDSNFEFISTICDGAFAIDGKTVPLALVSKLQNK